MLSRPYSGFSSKLSLGTPDLENYRNEVSRSKAPAVIENQVSLKKIYRLLTVSVKALKNKAKA